MPDALLGECTKANDLLTQQLHDAVCTLVYYLSLISVIIIYYITLHQYLNGGPPRYMMIILQLCYCSMLVLAEVILLRDIVIFLHHVFVVKRDQIQRLQHTLESDRASFDEKLKRELGSLKEQLQVRVQIIDCCAI